MKVFVIETHEADGIEWGISLTNHNPEPQDYFQMVNKETAFRLRDALCVYGFNEN